MASQFFPLDPETIKDMPLHEIFITLPEIMRAFGLSWEELRTELAEGRLKAVGVKMGAEYGDIGRYALDIPQ